MNRIIECVPHDLHAVASYIILLVQEYNAKLSDFCLTKDRTVGDKTYVSDRVMGTYGYAAPQYVMNGKCIVPTFSLHRSSSLINFRVLVQIKIM